MIARREPTIDTIKSNSLSLTVRTDSVVLTEVIDVYVHRSIEMLDIDNYFLHTENDKYVLMLLHGNLEELLGKVDPKLHRKYVITLKQGVPMLYAKLTKALYGMLISMVLFYKKLII